MACSSVRAANVFAWVIALCISAAHAERIKKSVVWYSQRLTEWLGEERFRHCVSAFQYGSVDVSGNPAKNDGLTQAWLTSSLKISPREQLSFLQKLVGRQLPVSAHAFDMTSQITAIGVLSNGWEIHGKTGTGFRLYADGTTDATRQVGWFVGWENKGARTLVFAHCIQESTQESVRAGLRARESLTEQLPALIDSL